MIRVEEVRKMEPHPQVPPVSDSERISLSMSPVPMDGLATLPVYLQVRIVGSNDLHRGIRSDMFLASVFVRPARIMTVSSMSYISLSDLSK